MNRPNLLRQSTHFVLIFSLGLLLPACVPSVNSQANVGAITPTVMPTLTPLIVTPTPSPTPTPAPTLTPTDPPPTPTNAPPATPLVNFDDLSPYRQAMRANFAADVDAVARQGVSRYYIEVSLDPASLNDETDPMLRGLERVRYTNTEKKPLSEIYFRLYPNLSGYGGQMTVATVLVDGQPVKATLSTDNTALRVPLAQPLQPGQSADLNLTYHVDVPRETTFGYNLLVYEDNTLALAGFYPAIAVYDEQGWQVDAPPDYGDATYLDTALYQVKLTVPQKMVVAASGSELGYKLNPDGSQTFSLASGPMRDFYLTLREDYQVTSQQVDGITVNSYYPAALSDGGQSALRHTIRALRVFEQRFGPYPYAEFDVAATPTRAGGVEYPGLVVINQQLYQFQGPFFEEALAHEVAHQWWYGLVGNNQVDEPWLDESLASYSTVFYWEDVGGKAAATEVIKSYFRQPYEQAKENGQDMAVLGPVNNFSERDYGIFVYGKGPLFFDALRREVGDEIYFKIMQTYSADYKYKIAHAADLWQTIEQVSEKDVDPLVKMWLKNDKSK